MSTNIINKLDNMIFKIIGYKETKEPNPLELLLYFTIYATIILGTLALVLFTISKVLHIA